MDTLAEAARPSLQEASTCPQRPLEGSIGVMAEVGTLMSRTFWPAPDETTRLAVDWFGVRTSRSDRWQLKVHPGGREVAGGDQHGHMQERSSRIIPQTTNYGTPAQNTEQA